MDAARGVAPVRTCGAKVGLGQSPGATPPLLAGAAE